MTTHQNPNISTKDAVLNALSLAGKSQQDAADALGIVPRTFARRLESDTLTLQDIARLSRLTGITPGAMLATSFLAMAG